MKTVISDFRQRRTSLWLGWLVIGAVFFFSLFTIHYSPITTYAQQQSLDVSYTHTIADSEAVDGDILMFSGQSLVRANAAYLNSIFGVLQKTPTVAYRNVNEVEKQPVARNGVALVNVTTLSGEIRIGDYITSSSVAGKGQKATQSGYVLGVALSDQNQANGQILVAVRIEYAEISKSRFFGRLFDSLNTALFSSIRDPDKSLQFIRFIAAAAILILSFAVGIISLSRAIPKSVEAIGRNPLAKRAIQISMIINIGMVIFTTLIGIAAAVIILRI